VTKLHVTRARTGDSGKPRLAVSGCQAVPRVWVAPTRKALDSRCGKPNRR